MDCAGSGQDGEFQSGASWPDRRFSLCDGDLVADHLTGLFWPRVAGIGDFPMSWREALNAVRQLNRERFLGHADWRLPNRRELYSLICHAAHRPALPPGHPFTIAQTWYWTSTTASIAPDHAWYVHLAGGRMFYGEKRRDYLVWPVRGTSPLLPRTGQRTCWDSDGKRATCADSGQDGALRQGAAWPNPRFTVDGAGIRDHLTDLTWMRDTSIADRCLWEEALHLAQTCRVNERNWRLPNIRELESLVDAQYHAPALPEGHPFTNIHEAYWSSTSSAYEPDWAYCLYLHKGAVGVGFKRAPEFHVWLVRD